MFTWFYLHFSMKAHVPVRGLVQWNSKFVRFDQILRCQGCTLTSLDYSLCLGSVTRTRIALNLYKAAWSIFCAHRSTVDLGMFTGKHNSSTVAGYYASGGKAVCAFLFFPAEGTCMSICGRNRLVIAR